MYRDSDGTWDGIERNGEHASFFALRETREERACEKLLDRNEVWVTLRNEILRPFVKSILFWLHEHKRWSIALSESEPLIT